MKTPGLGFDAIIDRVRTALRARPANSRWFGNPHRLQRISSSCPVRRRRGLPKRPMRSKSVFGKQFRTVNRQLTTKLPRLLPRGAVCGNCTTPSCPAPGAEIGASAPKAEDTSKRSGTAETPGSTEQPPSPPASVRDCPVCPEVVPVPAGNFQMGSTDGFAFERPVHRVEIRKPFYIGRREVTFDEWDACVSEGGCQYRPSDRGLGRGLRPVTDVDWNDAKTYLSWLSSKTGHAYRLPTEAEWEYAARGGSSTTYPWGNALEKDRANCLGCTNIPLNKAVETGTFPANGFGLLDMVGNAAEWVEDCWRDSYSGAPKMGSPGIKRIAASAYCVAARLTMIRGLCDPQRVSSMTTMFAITPTASVSFGSNVPPSAGPSGGSGR